MAIISEFYKRLRDLCEERNMTVNELARILNLSSGSPTAWKNGAVPRDSTVVKIADYFDTTADYLLGRTDAPGNDARFGLEDPAPNRETPTIQEDGRRYNVIKIVGRNGSYEERILTDEQIAALKVLLSQLPDASGDL